MKEEISCGAVIFRDADEPLFLLLKYEAGHWGFVKGRVEEGEDEKETVVRECEEETGITDLEFIPGFREKISYTYKAAGVVREKTVYFYLAETGTEEVRISHEHVDYEWLKFDEALERLTYDDTKPILKNAVQRLKSHDGRLDQYF